ncbi:MAG: PIN domain-containing protein [Luteolibacter sp.]
MKAALDSSIIVSALCAGDPDHAACRKVLLSDRHSVLAHALTETFSTLTGGRLGFRIPASDAATLLQQQVTPKLRCVLLDADEMLAACEEAEARGVRGGAIYDYLHLVAARKTGAKKFYTLNLSDFLSFHRPGDPEILAPI